MALPSSARAQTSPVVEHLLSDGVELRQAGRDEEALALFRHAYELDASPRVLAQVALAEQAVGEFIQAYGHLERVLAAATDPWVTRNREGLENARTAIEAQLVVVHVEGPTGVGVEVDGEPRGTLPARLVLAPGEHLIGAEGCVPQRVSTVANTPATVSLALVQAPPPPVVVTPPSVSPSPTFDWVPLAATLTGVGGAALLGGVGTTVGTFSLASRIENEICPTGTCRDPEDTLALLRDVLQPALYISGAVLAAAGVGILVLAPGSEESTDVSLACWPMAGLEGATLACGGSF